MHVCVCICMCVNSQEPPDDRFRRHREKLSEIIGENSTIYAIPLQMGFTTEDKIAYEWADHLGLMAEELKRLTQQKEDDAEK